MTVLCLLFLILAYLILTVRRPCLEMTYKKIVKLPFFAYLIKKNNAVSLFIYINDEQIYASHVHASTWNKFILKKPYIVKRNQILFRVAPVREIYFVLFLPFI